MIKSLKLGTRGSALARMQSQMVADSLVELHPHVEIETVIVRTLGDAIQNRPLDQLGRIGVFTAELETALLEESVDFAIHSLKDLPTVSHPLLEIIAISAREDPRDALVLPQEAMNDLREEEQVILHLPPNARVGTSSLRRRAQLLHARPDLQVMDLRGNVDTRLKKLDSGEYDACIFAAAGLNRLGLHHRAIWPLHPSLCMPDPGQGALAIQIRADREDLKELFAVLNHPSTYAQVTAERTVLAGLGGGCATPVGALAVPAPNGGLRLKAVVADPDGRSMIRAESAGTEDAPVELGLHVVTQLKASGADALLSRQKGPAALAD